MYGRCGSMHSAWDVFDDMPTKDIVSWNAMLSLLANLGLFEKTLRIFASLLKETGVFPNNVTYVNALVACTQQIGLQSGRFVHVLITENMEEVDVVVITSLLNMYGKSGCFEDAWVIFKRMPERNVITWNSMISHFTQQRQIYKAFELFHQMQSEGILAENATVVTLLSGCTSKETLMHGECLLACILNDGLKLDITVGNAVLNMYGKCGRLQRIHEVMNAMEEKNLISWTTIITACTQSNYFELALDYWGWMLEANVNPNHVTFVGILDACAGLGDCKQAKHMHHHIINDGYDGELSVQNSLIFTYGKCLSSQDACIIFWKMSERDTFSWNSVISAYAHLEDIVEAFKLFSRMLNGSILPNKYTYTTMIDVCSSHLAVSEGERIHSMVIESGYEMEVVVGTALINLYGKFNMLEDAQKAFSTVCEHNVISWTALITAYARQKRGWEALGLFEKMQGKGFKPNNVTFTIILASLSSTETAVEAEQMCHRFLNYGLDSDVVVGNTVISVYGKCGNVHCARLAFEKMHTRDIISWNAIIDVYAQNCTLQEVTSCLDQMIWEGFVPDTITLLSVIHSCSRQQALFDGRRFHCYMLELGLMKRGMAATALVSLYGKCGSVNDALTVFSNMCERDVVSWTAAILACAHNGQAEEGMLLFKQMQHEGVIPNEVTFSNVINACSHAGMLYDGLDCFTSMVKSYNLAPEVNHYVSLIDLLGRAGQINQADKLISGMPFQPNTVPYLSLLGACRQPPNVLQGQQAADQAMELDSIITAPYVVLSNCNLPPYDANELDAMQENEPRNHCFSYARS
ncbi:hypothetical protein KP509_37G004200 [Ceratopteris richardii]|nr:hypothetical protein KP509_37G004200 [Ceratopteris richardii]